MSRCSRAAIALDLNRPLQPKCPNFSSFRLAFHRHRLRIAPAVPPLLRLSFFPLNLCTDRHRRAPRPSLLGRGLEKYLATRTRLAPRRRRSRSIDKRDWPATGIEFGGTVFGSNAGMLFPNPRGCCYRFVGLLKLSARISAESRVSHRKSARDHRTRERSPGSRAQTFLFSNEYQREKLRVEVSS